jgi:general secretion pathway protein G
MCLKSRFRKLVCGGEKGFTLIELLIVIAVLGALAAVVVPAVSSFLNTANVAAANTEVQNVKTAESSYLADVGNYPATSDLLTTSYLSGAPKAKYTFDSSGIVTSVNNPATGATWTNIVFDISDQKWIKGTNPGTASLLVSVP